mmetsp:Transcript_8497/g.25173  ORF Transcript_8497/g.25173 Transcript_8497/m.25173 type:complete len:418 (-) Transcript_8497:220-1473(-)
MQSTKSTASSTRLLASLTVAALAMVAPASGFVPSQKLPAATKSTSELFQSSRSATPIGEVISAVGSGLDEEDFTPAKEKILKEPSLWEYNFGLQDPGLEMPHGLVKDVSAPEKFTITEEQIRTLEEDGVVHIKGVFDDEWVDYLRKATAYQVDEPHFWAFAGTASKLYDYIQRNVWQTNSAFARFYYHSAMGHVLAQCGRTDEIRVSTDLLMVNPNKGFKWHQDNQNGPISWEEGLRFWITMDETPKEYGAPVYLKGSHKNDVVDEQAVFVDIQQDGLEDYNKKLLEFRTMPGDMLIWHPRTIHKVDGPSDGIWTSYRRVLGGTVAKAGSVYHDKRGSGGVLSDLGRHGLEDGNPLKSSFFPVVYPKFDAAEAADRDSGNVGRNPMDIMTKLGGLATKASGERFGSFFQVLGSQSES